VGHVACTEDGTGEGHIRLSAFFHSPSQVDKVTLKIIVQTTQEPFKSQSSKHNIH
jgi:hypothetical protein